MASVLLRHVRSRLGEPGVVELLLRAGSAHSAGYLEDVTNWITYDEAIALFDAAAILTGDPDVARRVGEKAVAQHRGSAVATVLRALGSPEAVYEQLAIAVSRFSTATQLRAVEMAPGRAVLEASARSGQRRHRQLCLWTIGLLSQPPVLFGLPAAAVQETRCQARGDECCVYTATWDAAAAAGADPSEMLTAMEAQLVAMTDRLESVFATASDLIASDDVAAVLARITERAATAVRAPSYLLAVRIGPAGELHVHHRGLDDRDAQAAAAKLLSTSPDAQPESCVIAEVASGTRHYGRLMAASPAGGFFSHERDLFEVYGRYAAAVLDTATALAEARRRHEQSQALLTLAQSVAAAATRDEVAQRLIDAIPVVVDCDRVGMFLWHEQEGELRSAASTSAGVQIDDFMRELRIRPSDTRYLSTIVQDPSPDPLFLDLSTDDPFAAALLRRTGEQAVVIAPIVAHGRFYGVLTVSVVDRPERLRPTPALRDCLTGVVAHAATALDNAHLIETISHQARHDNLTGLLGNRAFGDALRQSFEIQESEGPITLAAIDVDDFKLINDLHGHPVGDEALRRVSAALRASVRDQDSVFRVGGDEFAVLLPGLTVQDALPVAERLREAVAATPFIEPLRISVGLASWPADASDEEGLLASADSALYCAKQTGKDRTGLAGSNQPDRPGIEGPHPSLLDVLAGKQGENREQCRRVAVLVVKLGSALGLASKQLEDLRVAGQLHDVGKLAVSDAVLNKPGPLDPDDLQMVRTHPSVGAELVRAWGFPAAARYVLEHQEHMDGSGYPAGLSGEQISLEGRILHAADAFTSMTVDRPYRRAHTPQAAVAEMRELSGRQFDPDVVNALERILAESGTAAA